MADVTIPTIPAGVAAGAIVEQNFYNPTPTGQTSVEIINGHLDDANRNPAWKIDRSQIQHGALSQGKSEGGTINLDYFGELFPSWENAQDTGGGEDEKRMDSLYQVIPGASVSFYLPYDPSFVFFSWHIFVGAQQKDLGNHIGPPAHPPNYEPAKIRFFQNGNRQSNRVLAVPTKVWTADDTRGQYDRPWTGHKLATGLTKGWHSASLRIAVDPGYNAGGSASFPVSSSNTQCRVRVRSMSYVIFR